MERRLESDAARPGATNARIADLLRDMATAQTSQPSRWGYKRAAAAVRDLDTPLESLRLPDGSLPRLRHIGPASTRIILEALDLGYSPTVERAVQESGQTAEVDRRRGLREHFLSRAEVIRVLDDPASGGPAPGEYQGDLQMHSEWSDGRDSLETLAAGCLALGYTYSAVTDHSHGLPIAGGLTLAEVKQQHDEIEALNREARRSFRLLKGIEANILKDGALDLSLDERRPFEVIVAAPHSRLRVAEDQTARMVTAVREAGVCVLGHPRGRMIGSRPGVTADWAKVFASAAEAGVAIEIDGDPARQDVDYELAGQAMDAGCLFALDSDAHSADQLHYADTALAHARLAGIPSSRIINCWPLDRLIGWLEGRRVARRRR